MGRRANVSGDGSSSSEGEGLWRGAEENSVPKVGGRRSIIGYTLSHENSRRRFTERRWRGCASFGRNMKSGDATELASFSCGAGSAVAWFLGAVCAGFA